MANDDLKKRIEALNKRPLRNVPDESTRETPEIRALRRKIAKQVSRPAQPAAVESSDAAPPEPIVYSRSAPTVSPTRAASWNPSFAGRDFGPAVCLEDAVCGVVTQAPAGPGFYLIEQAATELEAESVFMHRRFVSLTGYPDGEAVERLARVCKDEMIAPEEMLFLDLETTGLSMTPVFLVGTMECTDCGFLFRQYFARDYSEEISIVSAISERFKDMRLLVTFNGKTFDCPFLANRAVATGVKLQHPDLHLDLLHEARRMYKKDLPNCRLQTLEQMICGRSREDDIPGAEIPAAYHEFVRTGNANKISSILMHNLYDLLTMADLMHRMWQRD